MGECWVDGDGAWEDVGGRGEEPSVFWSRDVMRGGGGCLGGVLNAWFCCEWQVGSVLRLLLLSVLCVDCLVFRLAD